MNLSDGFVTYYIANIFFNIYILFLNKLIDFLSKKCRKNIGIFFTKMYNRGVLH